MRDRDLNMSYNGQDKLITEKSLETLTQRVKIILKLPSEVNVILVNVRCMKVLIDLLGVCV